MKLAVYLEYDGENLTASSNELLMMVKELPAASEIIAFVAGTSAKVCARLPVKKVYLREKATFGSDLAKWIQQKEAEWEWLFFPMTLNGREIAAYLSILTTSTLIYGVSGLELRRQEVTITRLIADAKSNEQATFPCSRRLLLGVAPNIWSEKKAPHGSADCEIVSEAAVDNAELRREYLASWTEIAVDEAKVVIAGGNGMGTEDNFQRLYQIGEILEAPVGGSRVAEDKGWIGHESMIGATGAAISPKLYLAWGISGAVQHWVGVRSSEKIIAVNRDAMCAMMQNADLAVVGDCNEILAILTEKLKNYQRTEAI